MTSNRGVHTGECGFEDVIVPAENRIGEPGAGWRLAMQALASSETGDIGVMPGYRSELRILEDVAQERGLAGDPTIREELAWAYVVGEVLNYDSLKQLSLRVSGRMPGMEGSVGKLLWSATVQEIEHVALDVVRAPAHDADPRLVVQLLPVRPASVFGGTEQIQRNIVAQRLLGILAAADPAASRDHARLR